MIRVGILGYGGIARSHRLGYEILASKGAPVELVALCDINPDQFSKILPINISGNTSLENKHYHTYTDLDEMLAREQLDTIDICLPTYLHCEYTVKLLSRGYNVQCEKPMGLNPEQCQQMIDAAKASGKKLMIGMCLRFDAQYLAIKEVIDSGRYGKVNSAHFERLSSLPGWGFEGWFRDYNRSGGVGMDLHVHDVDMIRFLFGEPKSISAAISDCKIKATTIESRFMYEDKFVSAIADWGMSKSAGFTTSFKINFDTATAVSKNSEIMIYPDDGEPYKLDYEPYNHMASEIEYFARNVMGEYTNEKNTPESAAATVELINKAMYSAENGGIIVEV